ncbi:MAG: D-alanyl-D-alanine carboxypeptidase [Candidatus Pacebacteria bacterium]|nr:D-alanyl-D-alanine carboxypeptidase [Candidatus Paceibacterota bacterium]
MDLFSKLKWTHYLSFFFIGFIIVTFPLVLLNLKPEINFNYEFDLVQIGRVPILKEELEEPIEVLMEGISADHYIVLDIDSGAVLLEKDSTVSAFPASTTKIMTALVAKENYDLDYILEVRAESLKEDNKLGFRVGEKVRVADLLHAALISSSNEAAEVLASGLGSGREEFVNLMNRKARDLNLDQTLFINPSGFDNENIYSTARDLGILSRELIKDDYLKGIVGIKEYSFNDVDEKYTHPLYNTNKLLHEIPDVTGVKTGTTDGAGQVLITLVEREESRVLIVVMGSTNRYLDTTQIIDWIFSSYEWVDVDINNLID